MWKSGGLASTRKEKTAKERNSYAGMPHEVFFIVFLVCMRPCFFGHLVFHMCFSFEFILLVTIEWKAMKSDVGGFPLSKPKDDRREASLETSDLSARLGEVHVLTKKEKNST